MSSDPSKVSGATQRAAGKAEEVIGKLTGSESWKSSGQERSTQGETEHKQAQTQGYAEGVKDRASGKKDQVVGSVTGDTSQEASGLARNEAGQTQQDWNRS